MSLDEITKKDLEGMDKRVLVLMCHDSLNSIRMLDDLENWLSDQADRLMSTMNPNKHEALRSLLHVHNYIKHLRGKTK